MRRVNSLIAAGVVLSSLSVLVLAWVNLWVRIAEGSADRGDYAVASGLYDVGIVLMLLGAVAVVVAQGARWVLWWCLFTLLFLVLATLEAHLRMLDGELPAATGEDSWWTGVRMALRMPWNWLVPISLVLAVLLRRPTVSAPGGAPTARGS